MAPAAVRLDRIARSAPWAAAFGFGLVSLLVARSHPGGSFGGTSWAAAAAELAAGWALIAVGLRDRTQAVVTAYETGLVVPGSHKPG